MILLLLHHIIGLHNQEHDLLLVAKFQIPSFAFAPQAREEHVAKI